MHINYVPQSFPKILRKALGYFIVAAVVVQTSGMYSLVNPVYPARASDTYLMYAVEDAGGSDSQFFTFDQESGTVAALGPQYHHYDIEAIDVHPVSGALYAIAGGEGSEDGKLFLVDKATGALTVVGATGALDENEIVSASFRPDGELWAFQEEVGIVSVDLANGNLTLKVPAKSHGVGDNWEGIAWDISGQFLYGAEGSKLYQYDPLAQSAVQVCGNNLFPSPTEALEFRPDGTLFGGWHNAADQVLSIFEIDMNGCSLLPTDYQIPYRDVESLTFGMKIPAGECVMEIEKTGTPEEVMPGDDIRYTITIKNTGTANCTGGGVELKEFYDAETEFVSALPLPDQGNNLWNFGTVVPGEEHVVDIVMKASLQAQDEDELVNKACTWAEQNGPYGDPDSWICADITTKVKIPPPPGQCYLTVEKSDGPDPVMPGQTLEYVVKVTNMGDKDCTQVALTEAYDARTTFTSAQPSPDTGDTIWQMGILAPLEMRTVGITMTVGNAAQDGDQLVNTACATSVEFPNGACDEEATAVIVLPPSTANLVIAKKVSDTDEMLADQNMVSMEEQMTYTITLGNTGNAGAEEVVLTDDYDETKVMVIATDGGTDDGDKIVYPIGVINPNQTVIKIISVIVKSGLTATTTFDNMAEATARAHPRVSDTVTTTVTVPPPQGFDLSLDKSVSPATILTNQEATFTIAVTNEGNINGTSVAVDEVLPSQLGYVSDTGGGAFNNHTGVWTIGNLTVGSTTSLSITVRALTNGIFENTAEIASADQTDIDSTPHNAIAGEDDQESAQLKVNELPGPPGGCVSDCGGGSTPAPRIFIVKSVNKPLVAVGEIVTYTFTVSAGGTTDALNVRVTDTLPAGFTFIEGATGARTWDFGIMDEGTSKTESYDVLVTPTVVPSVYENVVVATISNGTAPDNHSEARAQVEVRSAPVSGPQLTIQKSVSTTFINPDSSVVYTVTVKNIGGTTARMVMLEDVLPQGFTFVDGGTSIKVFALGDLAPGQTTSLSYTVHAAADVAAGFHTNIATARADHTAPVSDDAVVEVRVVEVLGFTTLPDTGTGGMNPLSIAWASLLMLCAGAMLAYRYRDTWREKAFPRISVNFLSQ